MEDTSSQIVPTRTRLIMQVNDKDGLRLLSVQVQNRMVIGRGSVDDGIDIDLTRFQAAEMGVSRQHAVLIYQDDVLFIQDVYSTNGTRINGKRLDPEASYRLRPGDELELGRLRITVRLVRG